MESVYYFIFLGVLTLSKAQSGEDDTTADNLILDEVGISVLASAGFVILVLFIGWLWFCRKMCTIQIKYLKKKRKEDTQYRQRLVLARRRLREHRNVQRAIEESLTAVNEGEGDTTPPHSIGGDDEDPDFGTTPNHTHSRDDDNDDWFFDIASIKQSPSPAKDEYIEPPSFESVISLDQQCNQPSNTTSYGSHPPASQQQRMLATLQNLPQNSITEDNGNGDHHEETTPIRRGEDRYHGDVQVSDSQIRMPSLMTNNETYPSSSSDEETTDSSTSSVNIDELINQHLTNVPTIGQVGCGQTVVPYQSGSGGPSRQPFQRFDPMSRIPIHPARLHPLEYSRSSS